jgi:hypothetical protein
MNVHHHHHHPYRHYITLLTMTICTGEAFTTLLTTCLATYSDCGNFIIEGDALLVVLAINTRSLFFSWLFANCLSDISSIRIRRERSFPQTHFSRSIRNMVITPCRHRKNNKI